MSAGTWLTLLLAFGAAVAIFLTTPSGRRLASRLGLRGVGRGRAPRKDREYLLRVCHGSKAEVDRRLESMNT